VRLDRDTSKAHGTCGESLHYFAGWLDLVDVDAGRGGVVDLELAADRAQLVGLGVELGELLVLFAAVLFGGFLQRRDRGRVVDVTLARVAPVIETYIQ